MSSAPSPSQDGTLIITTHRALWVDAAAAPSPGNSACLPLACVARVELRASRPWSTRKARLHAAARRVGGLDADAEWGHVLSLGEHQRVAAARLLAAKPDVAFLDEATSALDAASEAAVYAAVAASVE